MATPSSAPVRLATPIRLYAIAVVANYLTQIPYAIHLYGTAFSRSGAILLGATLVWFVAAMVLFRRGRRDGFWLLLGYALVQVLFYFDTQIVVAIAGSGLFYHLGQTQDLILWLTFLVGDINFIAAVAVVIWLVRHREDATGGRVVR